MIKEEEQYFIVSKTYGYDAKKKACVYTYCIINEDTHKKKKISRRRYERILRRYINYDF